MRSILRSFVLLASAVCALSVASIAAGDLDGESEQGLYRLTITSQLDPVVINTMHDWILCIEDADAEPVPGANISVRGGMPAHDHGLPTEPRVTRELGGGCYLLQGMRFHMNGSWEIEISIRSGTGRDVVLVPLQL